jgi:hypothetical protein
MITTPTPDAKELRDIPELAVLAVLDAALASAQQALVAYNPDAWDSFPTREGRIPPLRCVLASLLVTRIDELAELFDWYRLAVRPLPHPSPDDDIPF